MGVNSELGGRELTRLMRENEIDAAALAILSAARTFLTVGRWFPEFAIDFRSGKIPGTTSILNTARLSGLSGLSFDSDGQQADCCRLFRCA
jgi:hypothetical protein